MIGSAVYVMSDGETLGPFGREELDEMLFLEEVTPELLACSEGMREWRSLGEMFVWGCGELLFPIRDLVLHEVEAVVAGKSSGRDSVSNVLMSLRDLRSDFTRNALATVIRTNIALRQGLRNYVQGRAEGAIDAFPAEELFCCNDQLSFARDWHKAWTDAGGNFFAGRMIARKDSPVWLALSDFGHPFPPFSFDESMWVRDVDRDEAKLLGVLGTTEVRAIAPLPTPSRLVGIE